MLTLSHKYFIIIAEEKSFSKAADRIFISQQALSKHIAKLEKEYRVQLLIRSTPLQLTQAGRILYNAVQKFIDVEIETRHNLSRIADSKKVLRLGLSYSRTKLILPKILTEYSKLNPDVHMIFETGTQHVLENKLLNCAVDLLFYSTDTRDKENIHYEVIANDPYYAVMHKHIFEHYYSGNAISIEKLKENGISFYDLRKFPFLMYLSNNQLQQYINENFATINITPYVLMQSDNPDILFSFTKEQHGVMFCSKLIIPFFLTGDPKEAEIFAIPMMNLTFKNELVIGMRQNYNISQYEKNFIEVIFKLLTSSLADLPPKS